MSRDHIIPKFILRGFALDPTENKKHQKIMIYDKETKQLFVEEINDVYAIKNFNSPETEKYLAYKYEDKVAKLFQRIEQATVKNRKSISFSNAEYKLLFRFFSIMWRRNDIQLQKAKEMSIQLEEIMKFLFGDNYKEMLKDEYKNYSFKELFNKKIDDVKTAFYDIMIRGTNNDDPTVVKTIKNYRLFIVKNESKIHFLLHNTYATLRYMVPKEQFEINENDMPNIMIYPISKTLCFCLLYSTEATDLSKENINIPIEIWDSDEDIKSHFIDGYITETAKSFVVDETNIDFVKGLVDINTIGDYCQN